MHVGQAEVEHQRVAAVYLTPHHQYPTTVTLTAPRRLALLALARRHRFVIIEDDYDHEHHYDGRAVLPLASVDADVVAYVGSLSKVFAAGVRLGYVAARPEILERAVSARQYIDRAGDHVVERAISELIEDDWLGRHVRRVRREYAARRDALVHELERRLGGALSFRTPSGGMSLWTRIEAPGVSSDAWAERDLSRMRAAAAATSRLDPCDAMRAMVGYVGVPHGINLPINAMFGRNVGVAGGMAPVRKYLPDLLERTLSGAVDAGPVFDLTLPLDDVAEAYTAMDERRAIKVLLRP